MSRLTSTRDFEREISEIDAMLDLDRRLTEQHGPDPAAELMTAGLEQRRRELVEEMESRGDERMTGHEVDIFLSGAPVVGHSIDTEFLSRVLGDLQQFVRAVVAHHTTGLRRAGPVSQRIVERSTLRLAATFPGSFGLRLETADEQFDLELDDVSPVFRAIDAVVSLVDESEGDQELLDIMAPLGKRAVGKYLSLLGHLHKHDAEIRVSWPTLRGTREGVLRPREAKRRYERLAQVEVQTHTMQSDGRLDEAGIRRGYFGFITEAGEVITGRVGDHLLPELERYFNKPCRALFTVTELVDRVTGGTTRSYRLDQLAPPGEALFPAQVEE